MVVPESLTLPAMLIPCPRRVPDRRYREAVTNVEVGCAFVEAWIKWVCVTEIAYTIGRTIGVAKGGAIVIDGMAPGIVSHQADS